MTLSALAEVKGGSARRSEGDFYRLCVVRVDGQAGRSQHRIKLNTAAKCIAG
jgi:hypothetical protein